MSDTHTNNDLDTNANGHDGDDVTSNATAVADQAQESGAGSGSGRQRRFVTLIRALGREQSAPHDSPEGQSAAGQQGATVSGDRQTMEDWDRESIFEPQPQGKWRGISGVSVMLFGVVLPAILMVLGCAAMAKRITLVLLNHPIETLVELALLFSIPVVNYFVWSAICKNNMRLSRLRDAALGSTICASGIVSLVCTAGLVLGSQELISEIGTAFATGFSFMSAMGLLSGATGWYLTNRIRMSRDLPKARAAVIGSAVTGAILCLIAFIAAEARPWCVRLAQRQAVSNSPADQREGLERLRWLNPERELRMECADPRAAGLVGMFVPLKSSTQHQLYFALTGKPYSFRDSHNNDLSSMPDDYLSRHVVGDKLKGLSLCRSKLDGTIHPNTLTSTVHWTMVLKNDTNLAQEARAELKMPQGAVITALRLWSDGEALDGVFGASGKGQGGSTWLEAGHDCPAIITDLGHNRLLLHCYPVPQEEELKVQVTMAVPLKPDGSQSASIALPRFIATNFDLEGEYQLRLRSSLPLSSGAKGLKESTSAIGEKVLSGDLQSDQIGGSDLVVSATRSDRPQTVALLDKMAVQLERIEEQRKEEERKAQTTNDEQPQQVLVMIDGSKGVQKQLEDVARAMAKKRGPDAKPVRVKAIRPHYVVQSIRPIASPAPDHLVVVVDGSATIAPYRDALCSALEKLPPDVPTSLIVAHEGGSKLMEPTDLSKGLEKLRNLRFIGGQDNLHAVVKAAELAGESKGGTVLWVHGPQPALNREIYIMAPYVATPAFYELPLDSGDADTVEFFKNHSEIGPFTHVPRNATLAADLERFFSRWRKDSHDYSVALTEQTVTPAALGRASEQEAKELIALHAHQKVLKLIAERKPIQAAKVAVAYGLVTPVSTAVVSNAAPQTPEGELANAVDGVSGSSETLMQGISNGTIGPQQGDATLVRGVNTAGTVRVNNLANLEALLNIIANMLEVGAVLAGGALVLHGLISRSPLKQLMGLQVSLTPGMRISLGTGLIMFGLAAPGIINWFVASARDANLFS